jgi:hypothetical protein
MLPKTKEKRKSAAACWCFKVCSPFSMFYGKVVHACKEAFYEE